MFRKLSSPLQEFKEVKFRPGLNLFIAEKSQGSSATDSRNGAGKSSLIEILHFTLGLSRLTDSVLRHSALSAYSFDLTLDWRNTADAVSVHRSLSKRSHVMLSPNVANATQLVGTATIREWTNAIGRDLFNLPEEHPGVSSRALISLYIRRDSQHGFDDPVSTFARQTITEATNNVAYLLGLNWRLISGYQGIASRERLRKELKRATKDPVFGLVVGSASELRGQVVAAGKRVGELDEQLREFKVVPEYESIQQKADDIDESIRRSRLRDAADRRNLADLQRSVAADYEPDTSYVERVYRELGRVLPGEIRKSYDDVLAFHDSITSNRRAYLETEINAVRERLQKRTQQRAVLGVEHSKLLELLSQGGALDAYSTLSNQHATARAQLETLTSRLDTAKKLEATQAEIKQERLSLQQQISRDLDERAPQIDEINALFQSFVGSLYSPDRDAFVEIVPLETSLRIRPHIGGENSRGIGKMVIFCFDLTWAVLAHRGGRGPDFLVHDSHMFDGVDERQVARALQLSNRVCEAEGLQYIVTMNSDDLAKTEPFGFNAEPYVVDPRLTDSYADGGLFGIRFT